MPSPVFRPGSARDIASRAPKVYENDTSYMNPDGTYPQRLVSPMPTEAELHPWGLGSQRDLAINTPYPRQIPAGYNNPDGTPATIPDPSDPNSPSPPVTIPHNPPPEPAAPPPDPNVYGPPGESAGRDYGTFRKISQRGDPEYQPSNTAELLRKAAARRLGLE